MHLLEQCLSQPTDREQDLEMVLANVWQALVRTGSEESQLESPVWRLVRRFAGSVLITAPRVSNDTRPLVAPSDLAQAAPVLAFDMRELVGSRAVAGPMSAVPRDSGYDS